jgi:hypothetical protein
VYAWRAIRVLSRSHQLTVSVNAVDRPRYNPAKLRWRGGTLFPGSRRRPPYASRLSLSVSHSAYSEVPLGKGAFSSEAATAHSPPSSPTRTNWEAPRIASPRKCQTAGIMLVSGRGQRSAILAKRATHKIFLHYIRIKALSCNFSV